MTLERKKNLKTEATDLEALDTGLSFEEASLNFYLEYRDRAGDPLEAAFLEQMILEERGHLQALKDTRFYLTDPEGWFMEKERAGLDGV
jgi:rubrerythrin